MFSKIKDMWASFEAWVHSWFPGAKTWFMTMLGTLGMGAGAAYNYIIGLPETKWLNKEVLMTTSAVLFTLSFWFSNMGERVKARE